MAAMKLIMVIRVRMLSGTKQYEIRIVKTIVMWQLMVVERLKVTGVQEEIVMLTLTVYLSVGLLSVLINMLKLIMKNMGKRGFTLIELLVVISIMGILTVITVSQFETARRKARDVQRKADISAVSKALLMYYADYGEFPDSDTINNYWGLNFVDVGYTYMAVMPKENKSSEPDYCYVVSSDQKRMGLFTTLENKSDADCNRLKRTEEQDCADVEPYNFCGNDYYFAILSPNATLEDIQ